MRTSTLDATGIRIDVNQPGRTPRGMSFIVPLSGGRIEDGDVVIEARPNVEMRTDCWRTHEQIVALTDQVEANGGFMRQGDEIGISDALVVGRDAVELLLALWRRAEDRAADADAIAAARQQGEQAGARKAQKAIAELAEDLRT